MEQTVKTDRRIARTRRSLRSALVDLIFEKNYARISIRDLTHVADIGYATFFRHFKSKDELTAHVLMTLIDDLESRLEPGMSIYEEALTWYCFVDENKRVCHAAFKLPRNNPTVKLAWDCAREVTHKRYNARADCEIPFDASINHLMRSVWELTRWWLQDASHYSPEEIATIHTELIVKVTEQVALSQRAPAPAAVAVG